MTAPNSVQQIKDMPNKAVVYCFSGTVSKAFPRNEGTNDHGPWSIEPFMVKDSRGDEIRLVMKDKEPLNWKVGHRFTVEAWQGNKGWTGLFAVHETFRGVPRTVLEATKTCNISAPGGSQQHEQQQQEPQHDQRTSSRHQSTGNAGRDQRQDRQQQERPQGQGNSQQRTEQRRENLPQQEEPSFHEPPPQQQQRKRPQDMTPEEKLKDARKSLMRVANLHLLCTLVVERYEAPAFNALTGQNMTEGQRQAAVATIFIRADKDGLASAMPEGDATNHPDFVSKK